MIRGGDHPHAVRGLAAAGLSAICYAIMPLAAKFAYRFGAEPMDLLSIRFLLAVPIFWLVALAVRRNALFPGGGNVASFLVCGAVFFGLSSVLTFHAYRMIDVSLAVVLLYTYPPIVGVWGKVVRKERFGLIKLLSLVAAFTGVVMTVWTPSVLLSGQKLAGIGMILAAAVLYSFYSLVSQRLVGESGALVFSTWSVTGTFLLIAAVNPPWRALAKADLPVLASAAVIALVSTFLAIYLYAKGIELVGATRASIVSNLEPAGVVILSYLLLGERLNPVQLAGGMMILLGVYLLRLEKGEGSRVKLGEDNGKGA
jgi:drug/metabolite transporter (DMT)-like permease